MKNMWIFGLICECFLDGTLSGEMNWDKLNSPPADEGLASQEWSETDFFLFFVLLVPLHGFVDTEDGGGKRDSALSTEVAKSLICIFILGSEDMNLVEKEGIWRDADGFGGTCTVVPHVQSLYITAAMIIRTIIPLIDENTWITVDVLWCSL